MLCGCPNNGNDCLLCGFFRRLKEQRLYRRRMLALYAEVEKNLEAYYVMFQLNRLRFFSLEAWAQCKDQPGLDLGPSFLQYVAAVGRYQEAAQDFKGFEQWYGADVERKTQGNARLVHEKKEAAQARFDGLEPVIKNAREELRARMVADKFLKV